MTAWLETLDRSAGKSRIGLVLVSVVAGWSAFGLLALVAYAVSSPFH